MYCLSDQKFERQAYLRVLSRVWSALNGIVSRPIHLQINQSSYLPVSWELALGRRINSDPLGHPVYLTYDVFLPLETRAILQ